MMETETAEVARNVSEDKIKAVLNKSTLIIAAFILAFGIPLVLLSYYLSGEFWATYTRVWAISGMIMGFLLGIPTGMLIFGKFLFRKTKL